LNNVEMVDLLAVHRALCDSITQLFPEYRGRRVIKRQMKKTVIPDICNMTTCLANKLPSRDLDCIFLEREVAPSQSNGSGSPQNASDFHDLLTLVYSLRDKVFALEATGIKREAEIQSLREEIDSIKSAQSPANNASTSSSSTAPTSGAPTRQEPEQEPSEANAAASDLLLSNGILPEVSPGPPPADDSAPPTNASAPHPDNPPSNSGTGPRANSPSRDPRPQPLRSAESNRKAEIYIGGLHKENSCIDVIHHLAKLGVVVTPQDCTLLTKPHHSTKSYKVTVDDARKSAVLNRKRYPGGLTVRPFRAPLSHSSLSLPRHTSGSANHSRPFRPAPGNERPENDNRRRSQPQSHSRSLHPADHRRWPGRWSDAGRDSSYSAEYDDFRWY
jgi:hypothetical protein